MGTGEGEVVSLLLVEVVVPSVPDRIREACAGVAAGGEGAAQRQGQAELDTVCEAGEEERLLGLRVPRLLGGPGAGEVWQPVRVRRQDAASGPPRRRRQDPGRHLLDHARDRLAQAVHQVLEVQARAGVVVRLLHHGAEADVRVRPGIRRVLAAAQIQVEAAVPPVALVRRRDHGLHQLEPLVVGHVRRPQGVGVEVCPIGSPGVMPGTAAAPPPLRHGPLELRAVLFAPVPRKA
mmetsp:Transcript_72398/g.204642  ORF Transcript_72398/g.204642 Transcript_72398/m.204642 type:complete len:235 (-) Transcript_72398:474-1178(-)